MTAGAVPPLAERRKPGLSVTLDGPRDPRRCQACGARHTEIRPLERWLEHDEWDRVPVKPAVVVLCSMCSRRLIDPHPRLYRQLADGESFPGCMGICVRCAFREGVACGCPEAKVNGGPGVKVEWTEAPIYAHVDGVRNGRRYGETRWLFSGPPIRCSGRAEVVS